MEQKYVIGLDYGTDSVRALLVDALSGKELGSAVHYYTRWKEGKYCDPQSSQFRQHPLDYIEGMERTITEVLGNFPADVRENIKQNIKAISIDTTGSTPVAVDERGVPLALLPEFSENPNAMFVLWKDHTAVKEAREINELSHKWKTDFTKYSGGTYSTEWFWSKMLHILREDEQVRARAFSWLEHCDWMPALLTGNTNPLQIRRSRCAAGHKAMWHKEFGGLPSQEFLTALDPLLEGIRERLYQETFTSDQAAGIISSEWAMKLGLPEDVVIGVGALDAHFGAVGAAIEPYTLVKVIGTSTCDMLTVPLDNSGDKLGDGLVDKLEDKLIQGICGQVDGSIVPGMLGMEAGQSAFGDFYGWFQQILSFPLKEIASDVISEEEIERIMEGILPALSVKASQLPVSVDDEVALDWINGRRTPDANQEVKGILSALTLASSAASLFKAMVEATAFGSKAIVKRFEQEQVPIRQVIALGGIAKKSPYVMQTLASVLNVPIAVASSDQVCALGAAMFASVVAGIYPDIETAIQAISSGFDQTYYPDKEKVVVYQQLYNKYEKLGAFAEAMVQVNG
ncbi:ribulokinase [Desertivirga xinjiangensis]|uniref:ribulokinase n=1 Tax=Desertivirga xinjiangensis TaxID=539206 RepID=UPI00210DD128|nr:ribulokinase [Pedobacter xinjiangensis]